MPKTLMQSVVSQLQKERTRLEDELHRITTALVAFGNVYMYGSQPKRAAVATRKRRIISAAGRKRIAAAQRARWAKTKGQKVVSISVRKGRKMSPAARKRIVAAQKALGKMAEGPKEGLDSRSVACPEAQRLSENLVHLIPHMLAA
jgi:hypothetical protein